jgi:hypothetical protein
LVVRAWLDALQPAKLLFLIEKDEPETRRWPTKIDFSLLETVHIAGSRFDRMIKKLIAA